jgi:hypothetical protein
METAEGVHGAVGSKVTDNSRDDASRLVSQEQRRKKARKLVWTRAEQRWHAAKYGVI